MGNARNLREFGVSVTAACNAATGRTWKTLEMAA
jgi:hypothetical protein